MNTHALLSGQAAEWPQGWCPDRNPNHTHHPRWWQTWSLNVGNRWLGWGSRVSLLSTCSTRGWGLDTRRGATDSAHPEAPQQNEVFCQERSDASVKSAEVKREHCRMQEHYHGHEYLSSSCLHSHPTHAETEDKKIKYPPTPVWIHVALVIPMLQLMSESKGSEEAERSAMKRKGMLKEWPNASPDVSGVWWCCEGKRDFVFLCLSGAPNPFIWDCEIISSWKTVAVASKPVWHKQRCELKRRQTGQQLNEQIQTVWYALTRYVHRQLNRPHLTWGEEDFSRYKHLFPAAKMSHILV